MKKLISLVLALAMMLTVTAAFAANGALDNDPTIQITGLEAGDQVTLYQVLEWDGYWKATDDYATALSQANVDDLVGQNHESGAEIPSNGGLTAYIDTIIAVKTASPVDTGTADADGVYSYASTNAGMYYAVVTPKNGTRVYKPIFISSDYNLDNASKTLAVTNAKYETVTLEKDSISQTNDQDAGTYTNGADSDNTVGVGDVVEFTLTTTIPQFPVSFTNPIFKVSDSLRYLELVANSGVKDIRVYSPTYDPTAKDTNLVAATDNYTITSADSASFTVAFSEAYIKANGNKQVVVVYTAKVLNEGTNIIDNSDNTAKVNFSNNPDDKVGANEIEDHTEHYSFTINGDVWTQYDSTDVVKVGFENGKEILQNVEVPNGHYIGALKGAKFSLYESDAEGKKTTNIYKDYNNNIISGDDGRFTISNLDAGTYWLVEEEAPTGYIKQQEPVKVEIIPVFATHTVSAQTKTVNYDTSDPSKTVEVTVPSYTYAELASYKIKIDGKETASYSFLNDAITDRGDDKIGETVSGGDDNEENDDIGKVKNPKGVELPSTGGIGTTIFYVLGGLLVVGAAIILVSRRKAHD